MVIRIIRETNWDNAQRIIREYVTEREYTVTPPEYITGEQSRRTPLGIYDGKTRIVEFEETKKGGIWCGITGGKLEETKPLLRELGDNI